MRTFICRFSESQIQFLANVLAEHAAANPKTYADDTTPHAYLPACFHSLLHPIDSMPCDEPMLNDFTA
jgi:hypothetical protein